MRQLLLTLAFLSLPSWAGPSAADFNYTLPLQTQGGAAHYQLQLPPAVYLNSQRSDLGDLRMFNAAGELLPYAVRSPILNPIPAQSVALPFFAQNKAQSSTGSSTQIKRNRDGSLVEITQQALQKNVIQHLLDASQLKLPINTIKLGWQDADYSGTVIIDASQDLQNWHQVSRGTVLNLQYQGQQLAQQELQLNGSQAKYLRLSWPEGAPQLLQSVQAALVRQSTAAPHEWLAMNIAPEKSAGEYQFNTASALPIDQMRIILPQINTLVRTTLYSRAKPDAQWQARWQGVLYRLARNTGEVSNTPAMFSPNSHTEWKLQVDTQGGGIGNTAPKIEMGWTPSTLLFIARGNPPFTLAYGNKNITSAAQSENDLLIDKASPIGIAKASQEIRNPNPASQSDPAQQKKWLLWGALLIAVAVLGLMARSLLGQLKSPTQ